MSLKEIICISVKADQAQRLYFISGKEGLTTGLCICLLSRSPLQRLLFGFPYNADQAISFRMADKAGGDYETERKPTELKVRRRFPTPK